MIEPFAAGVRSATFFPGRVYLKHTSAASVVRTIGASNQSSLSANFYTHTARCVKGNTNVENPNCRIKDSREWAYFGSKHSILCSSKINFINKCVY